jgi:D-beta-D-heptose 7-phosphate kinase/D-beta-D-heptose 1-phosphate adenosyltransferase
MKVVLVTGGFDPLHSGHVSYFNAAKRLGDILVVGLNSDEWLTRKKGRPFMNLDERMRIVSELKMVDYVIKYNDADNSSCLAIKQTRELFPDAKIIFANGGDRGQENTLEMNYKDRGELEFAFGVGGSSKLNSSSWILENWSNPKTERPWGYYRVLYETPNTKVKELTVNPGQSLSMQKHEHRNEHWHVVEGVATVHEERQTSTSKHSLYKHHTLNIPCGVWHQLKNETEEPLKIVEIQWGTKCIEEDIERK